MARPEKWRDEFVRIAAGACRLGATDADLADILDVSVRTINYWRANRPEFAEALKAGKTEADDRVERSLYQRATGYEQDAVKIFMPAGAAEPVYAEYRERIAPDTTACIFWLKNRRPAEWRDRVVHSGDAENPIKHEHGAADALAAILAGMAERKE